MSIIRGPRPESNWYALDKRISEDTRLTWAARGLLVYLLGKPDSWRVSIEHLRAQTEGARVKTGRDGVYALLGELQSAGYVTTRRNRGDDGTLGPVDYIVRERPEASDGVSPRPAQQEVDASPHPAQPYPAQPYPAQTTLVKTERASKTERAVTKGAAAPVLPDWLPADAWQDWHAYRNARKGWTAKARELSLRKLESLWSEGHDPRAVIEQSIENGWAGLFPIRHGAARAGPAAAPVGKQMQGIKALEDLKNAARQQMAAGGSGNGVAEAVLSLAGSDARR